MGNEIQLPDGDPPLAPNGPVSVTDPALASFANFTIQVSTSFNGGSGNGQNGYNRAAHKFDESYINPPNYVVVFDAKLGLDLNRRPEVARAVIPEGRTDPTTIEEFEEFLMAAEDETGRGDGDAGSGGGAPFIPDDLVAYQWVLEDTEGPFVASKLVMRPVSPMHSARFEVPRPGRYHVRLRVVFADGRQGERKAHFEFRDWFIVSMGDSAASGEGNPDEIGTLGVGGGTVCRNTSVSLGTGVEPKMNNDPVWTEKEAHRSMKSGPALAARSLQRTFGGTWSPVEGDQFTRLRFDKVVFASFARSGAGILTGLISRQEGDGDFIGVGQMEECRRTASGRRIDALMISIGGNDAGFAGVLTDLVRKDSVFRARLRFLGTGNDAQARRDIEKRLDALLGIGLPPGQKGELEVRYEALRDQVDNLRQDPGLGEVYISGYPTSLFQFRKTSGQLGFRACEVFAGPDFDISDRDGEAIQSRGLLLNALIKRKAEEFGWHYVDVEADFEGRGYCAARGTRFWVHAEESCRRQGDFDGTMHPNHLGQHAYALRLSQAMRQHTFPRTLVAPPRPTAPQGPAAPINN